MPHGSGLTQMSSRQEAIATEGPQANVAGYLYLYDLYAQLDISASRLLYIQHPLRPVTLAVGSVALSGG